MTITAYPLTWPAGWPRTSPVNRRFGHFGTRRASQPGGYATLRDITLSDACSRTIAELVRMGIVRDDIVISTNVALRLDGLPRSDQRAPADPGAAVYWQDGAHRRCMAIDRYMKVEDNLAAIAATIEAMRAIERHGGAQILDRAFTGFTALPAPGRTRARGWREILGIDANERDLAKVQEKYRRLAAVHHPDRGGTTDSMSELNWAWAQAQETLKGTP